jgi:hypothetical protein
MPSAIAALLITIAAVPAERTDPDTAFDTVVVCPAAFRETMKPWLELRTGQGHRVKLISNLGPPEKIRDEIRETASAGRLRFVLLVGGADPKLNVDAGVRARSVPMHYAAARINVKWGSTRTIPTDNWYVQAAGADDESPLPTIAVGRLPATSPEELAVMVKKIVAYERSEDLGPWRQRLNIVAGVGNFGFVADALLETTATTILTENVPAEYHVSMTYANWRSPYCPDPRRFHAAAIERLDEGSFFWVFIGHAAPHETALFEVPGHKYPILKMPDAAALRGSQGRPIALFLSCLAGAVDTRGQCLASALAAAPGGPVAVIAGTRVTMPYGETLLAMNLSDELFRGQCETLGEALLHAKQKMLAEPKKDDARRALLDALAATVISSNKNLAAERAEHVLMYNLIGDPLLRLRHPQPVNIQLAKSVPTGGSLQIDGLSPIAGRATVELVVRRDRTRLPRPARNKFPANANELAAFDEVYNEANDGCLKSVELAVQKGPFQAKIAVPPEAIGTCAVSVFIAGKGEVAMGSAPVQVVRPKKSVSILGAFAGGTP